MDDHKVVIFADAVQGLRYRQAQSLEPRPVVIAIDARPVLYHLDIELIVITHLDSKVSQLFSSPVRAIAYHPEPAREGIRLAYQMPRPVG